MTNIIYHVTTKAEWAEANKNGFYEATSLQPEGFIHCSEEHQVAGVLNRYFTGKGPLVKLTIDTNKLHCRMQCDYSARMNDYFPHIYGRLNLDAVTEVSDIE